MSDGSTTTIPSTVASSALEVGVISFSHMAEPISDSWDALLGRFIIAVDQFTQALDDIIENLDKGINDHYGEEEMEDEHHDEEEPEDGHHDEEDIEEKVWDVEFAVREWVHQHLDGGDFGTFTVTAKL